MSGRGRTRRAAAVGLLLLLAATGCRPAAVEVTARASAIGSATSSASSSLASPSGTPLATPGERLPAGFPVMPGASPAPLPDNAAVAAWTIPQAGSAAYDFYRRALPAAGLRILGLYPTELAALIRFEGRNGAAWQLLAERAGDGTRITLRPDLP